MRERKKNSTLRNRNSGKAAEEGTGRGGEGEQYSRSRARNSNGGIGGRESFTVVSGVTGKIAAGGMRGEE